jgi:hypothetical protein
MSKLSLWSAATLTFAGAAIGLPANAQQALGTFGGDLIISSSTYTDEGFASGTPLPFNASGTGTTSTLNATSGSAFCANSNCSQNVWNNVSADANFGITSGIFLQDINRTTGQVDNTVNVTQLATMEGINLVTSFSSKSELAINLSPDGSSLTFMGYNASIGQFDVSNSNTPGAIEPGNTDIQTPTYRAVGQISLSNNALQVTTTNAYNGNNGRAAIAIGNGEYYTVGNAGNGNGSAQTTANTGVQLITASGTNGGLGTNQMVGQFNCVTQEGTCANSDKTAKDNNYRGETIFGNTLYISKGSGSNGIDTVYQVGSTGTLPAASTSTPIDVLPGFNTAPAKTDTDGPHPFGLWFANATTLYVADEGSGAATDFGANPTTQAGGLDKYTLKNGTWQLDYELKGTLIGSSYTVNGTGSLAGDSLLTTVDGLRNLTGTVNGNGTVTLYAVTSTEGSLLGDEGADPNQIVTITDALADTSASQAAGENFSVLDTAALGQVYRGVAVAPVPLPPAAWLLLCGLGGLGLIAGRRRNAPWSTAGLALCALGGACASAEASTIAQWNFGTLPVTAAPDNSPAATTGTGTATTLGMTNSYTYPSNQSGGGGTQTSSVASDDITNDSSGFTGSVNGNGNVWRIRGATTSGNGWNNSAPEYSQGVQFSESTAGFNGIDLSFEWASTAQGVGNLQVEYTTNGTAWTKVGSLINATVDSSSGGGYQTDTINFGALGITSVNNDPNFGVRLVSAFNPSLAGGTEYASASSVVSGSPTQYNDFSGNWRFADVSITGTAAAPVPLPAAAWLLLSGLGGFGALRRRRKAP